MLPLEPLEDMINDIPYQGVWGGSIPLVIIDHRIDHALTQTLGVRRINRVTPESMDTVIARSLSRHYYTHRYRARARARSRVYFQSVSYLFYPPIHGLRQLILKSIANRSL